VTTHANTILHFVFFSGSAYTGPDRLPHAPRLRPQLAFNNTNDHTSPRVHSLEIQVLSLTVSRVPVSQPASLTRRSMDADGIIRCGMMHCRGITDAALCSQMDTDHPNSWVPSMAT
jgi:hypothetical protein